MSKLFLRQIANLGSEHTEVYWLVGFVEEENGWFVRTVMRGIESHRHRMVLLPIGFAPLLSLGHIFAEGELLSLPARGVIGKAAIADLSEYTEITSAAIPETLYSFSGKEVGVQHLLRYHTAQGEIFIPAIELIRYLFLHNRTLANAIMRPGAINLLFQPQATGFQKELTLRFTSEMPFTSLSRQFAEEFAWLALDPDARHSWDSVYLQSRGKQYVTFTPPTLKNSTWQFRGAHHGNQWLVLELLHLSGKDQPCDVLHYGHPSMKQIERDCRIVGTKPGADADTNAQGGTSKKRFNYDYELDDGQQGSKTGNQKTTEIPTKQSDFKRNIVIEKLLIKIKKAANNQEKLPSQSNGEITEVRKKIKVTAGEKRIGAALPPLEFKLLTPMAWERIGDLKALADTVKAMAEKAEHIHFAMSLCQLKSGRVFSLANRKPRVGLVVTITPPDTAPILLLDVERTGDVALALVALRFHMQLDFSDVENVVQLVLDGLVESSGHWNHEIEQDLEEICTCERMPRMLTPRDNAKRPGQATVWAMKLLRRLGLDPAYGDVNGGNSNFA